MSLREFENVMARLVTDGVFRAAFLADREAALVGRELTASEQDSLRRLSGVQIERFARSLHSKRQMEAAPLIPWAVAALGERFGPLFREHCARYQPTGLLKPGDDARTFCAVLAESQREPLDALTRELLCWEATRRTPPSGHWQFRVFRVCPRRERGLETSEAYVTVPGWTLLWSGRGGWHSRSWPQRRKGLTPQKRP